ncbi:hypothetical protein Q5P01_025220 [Channa striata]|uniref:Uncharacterized protein n=1 Tax=Channa striata TaxID=64152 RepID=A0AA88J1M1_CHASR|nr:hypothetical protein Q5P01_025220 [Channa striata]
MKSLFLKTYGKKKQKLSAWISPDNRKRAFDSTPPSDGDSSVFEPAKPARTCRAKMASVANHRAVRPAKKKAKLFLKEKSFDDEDISEEENLINLSPPCPPPAQEIRTRRRKKTSGRGVRPVKRKTVCLIINTSDEENSSIPRPSHHQPAQWSKITSRKSQLALEPTVSTQHPQVPMNSDDEKKATVHPSVGRFVTRRRRASATKPQRPKARVTLLNSSNEFSSGALSSSRILRPSRRRRLPPTFIVSSAENSMNAAGTSSFASNPLQEISLNELSDHSLGPCARKPIYCSTPSADPFNVRQHLKPFHMIDHSSSPLSMSVSCIGQFQEDVDCPQQPIAAVNSESPTGQKPELDLVKTPHSDLHHLEHPSGDLFKEASSTNKRIDCSEQAKSISEDTKSKSSGELQHTVQLSEDSESSSYFVSAAGGLEWLIEALKEKCLTKRCTVQLERLDIPTVTQLCSQTTYSSCLGDELSLQSQQTDKHPIFVNSGQTDDLQSSEASFDLHLSVTNDKNSAFFPPVNSFDSPDQAASVTGRRSSRTRNFDSPDDMVSIKQPSIESQLAQKQCEDRETKRQLLKSKCLASKLSVDVNRITLSELKEVLKLKNTKMKLPSVVSDSPSDGQTNSDHQSKREADCHHKDTFSMEDSRRKRTSTSSEDKIPTNKEDALTTTSDIFPKEK